MRAIGYLRVSTEEQGQSGLGLDAQATTVHAEIDRRGWEYVARYTDIASGKSLRNRHEFAEAMRVLAAREADVLVVAKLDRLSRSVSDFAAILHKSQVEGWALDVCDLGVDTTTPSGKMVAQIMMVLAEWEREMIGDRTKNALAAARARGQKLGRPQGISDETVRLIRVMRGSGLSWGKIAAALEREGVKTGQGGQWHATTVRKLHNREVSTDAQG
jgi:DNA invertase Pin-like site-specific DNA recombinase